jgi:hypothetical protein
MLNLQISQNLLTDLTTIFQRGLGKDLAGLYLWGSALSSDFVPTASDLDLLVVLTSDLDSATKKIARSVSADFLNLHPEWRERVEIVCVDKITLAHFRAGGTLFHLSRNKEWQDEGQIQTWLRSWYLVRQTAQVLWGPPIEMVIPPISKAEFRAAVRASALELSHREIATAEPSLRGYFVLTMCRAWVTLTSGGLPSKITAAAEVSAQKPQWAGLLVQAQRNHATAGSVGLIEPGDCALAQDFLAALGQEIASWPEAEGV